MEITSIPAAAATTTPTAGTSNSVLSSDFETFLQMLTAQAQYQDPLDPISSSDYAAQLAQFSMVEQQVLTNELLQAQTSPGSANGQVDDPSSWLGLEVRTRQTVPFNGNPISLEANPPALADQMILKVYDQNDRIVYEQNLTVQSGPVIWPGRDNNNAPLPIGEYRVEVESLLRGELQQTDTFTGLNRVTEVQVAGGQTTLVLSDGSVLSEEDIIGLRESTLPDSSS